MPYADLSKRRTYHRQYYLNFRNRLREIQHKYYLAHKQQWRIYAQRSKDTGKKSGGDRVYRQVHRRRLLDQMRVYYLNHKEAVHAYRRRRYQREDVKAASMLAQRLRRDGFRKPAYYLGKRWREVVCVEIARRAARRVAHELCQES